MMKNIVPLPLEILQVNRRTLVRMESMVWSPAAASLSVPIYIHNNNINYYFVPYSDVAETFLVLNNNVRKRQDLTGWLILHANRAYQQQLF
jgi:hypothetical protein